MDYAECTPRYPSLVRRYASVEGPQATLEQVYEAGHSRIVQEVVLVTGSKRVEFRTRLVWREIASMLRTSFAVDIHAEEATYEIQFGHIRRPTHRNTTWDLARDEVAAHKWVDLSQGDYGVALLNDCKYGHKVKDNVIDLNLLRSVRYPGARVVQDNEFEPGEPHHGYTDQADHEFTYALYPHLGDHVQGRVVQAGYELNVPLRVVSVRPGGSSGGPGCHSYLRVDDPSIVVEAIKRAEEGEDLIVRLYASEHRGVRTALHFGFPVESVHETNLVERETGPDLPIDDGCVHLTFAPFEIKTLRVRPGQVMG
jgi:alpha-mannosidase